MQSGSSSILQRRASWAHEEVGNRTRSRYAPAAGRPIRRDKFFAVDLRHAGRHETPSAADIPQWRAAGLDRKTPLARRPSDPVRYVIWGLALVVALLILAMMLTTPMDSGQHLETAGQERR